MSKAPTPADLHAIVGRHHRDESAYACVESLTRSATKREPPHADRGTLLDLLRAALTRCNEALPDDSAEHYNALRDIQEMLQPLALSTETP